MFTSDINIRVLGYLMGEGKDDDRPIITLEENAVEITFPRESIAEPGSPDFFGNVWSGKTPPDESSDGSS